MPPSSPFPQEPQISPPKRRTSPGTPIYQLWNPEALSVGNLIPLRSSRSRSPPVPCVWGFGSLSGGKASFGSKWGKNLEEKCILGSRLAKGRHNHSLYPGVVAEALTPHSSSNAYQPEPQFPQADNGDNNSPTLVRLSGENVGVSQRGTLLSAQRMSVIIVNVGRVGVPKTLLSTPRGLQGEGLQTATAARGSEVVQQEERNTGGKGTGA